MESEETKLIKELLRIINQQFNGGLTRPAERNGLTMAGCQSCGCVAGESHEDDCEIGNAINAARLYLGE